MTNHPRRMLGLAAAFLLAATAGAQAQGHGHGNDKDKGNDRDKGHEQSTEVRQDARQDVRQEVRRNARQDVRQEVRRQNDNGRRHDVYTDRRNVPPGLAKKPGGMPPGQYKKRYGTQEGASVLRDIFVQRGYTVVRTGNAGQSQYVYYRLRDGSVRRAIVSPGNDQLVFNNVPSSLLREVLARLY